MLMTGTNTVTEAADYDALIDELGQAETQAHRCATILAQLPDDLLAEAASGIKRAESMQRMVRLYLEIEAERLEHFQRVGLILSEPAGEA